MLEGTTTEQQSNEPSNLKINELFVVVWQNCDAAYEWHIGYKKNVIADGYCIDHLHQVNKYCCNKWKCPSQEHVHTAEFEEIVNCAVHREWDITPDTRERFFTVKNIKDIINTFNNHVK